MNIILIVLYFIFSVSGSTFIKFGSMHDFKILFSLPIVNMPFTWVTLIGFLCYGLSFLVYTVLLNRFDLSFISPITVGVVYVLLMLTAFIIFKEDFTFMKLFGSTLVIAGVLIITVSK